LKFVCTEEETKASLREFEEEGQDMVQVLDVLGAGNKSGQGRFEQANICCSEAAAQDFDFAVVV